MSSMALIKMGTVVSEISGSIDGVTFSHNRNGRYARARVKPTNPKSVRQTAVRSQLASLSAGYRALSTSQKTGWTSLGAQMVQTNRLGAATNLTGAQAYISVNQLKVTAGQAVVSSAPILDSPPTITSLTLTVSFTTAGSVQLVSLAYTLGGSPTATQTLRVYSTGPLSAGKSFIRKSQYRLLGTVAANAASPFVLTGLYQSTYGAITAGTAGAKISMLVVPTSTNGFAGPAQRVDATVVII